MFCFCLSWESSGTYVLMSECSFCLGSNLGRVEMEMIDLLGFVQWIVEPDWNEYIFFIPCLTQVSISYLGSYVIRESFVSERNYNNNGMSLGPLRNFMVSPKDFLGVVQTQIHGCLPSEPTQRLPKDRDFTGTEILRVMIRHYNVCSWVSSRSRCRRGCKT